MPKKAVKTAGKKPGRPVKHLRCSFCRKDDRKVSKLVGGPNAYICEDCVGLCNRILADESISRWAWLTDGDLLDTLPASCVALEASREALRTQVNLLRERKVSWAAIGGALGISRQAAWDRFS